MIQWQANVKSQDHDGHEHNSIKKQGEKEAQRISVTRDQVSRFGIKITRAVKGLVRSEIRVPGEIKVNSDRLVHVVPQTSGTVLKVFATLGDKVKKGQVLAVLSSRELTEAKVEYLASAAHLKLTQTTYNREKHFHDKKISSEHEFLVAKQALIEAKIRQRSARQNLVLLGIAPSKLLKLHEEPEDEFSSYRILAPLNGTIIKKHIQHGEVIDEKTEAFVIADLDNVWADLVISQDVISSIKKGQTVKISLLEGVKAESKIGFISPIVDSDTRTALARATLNNLKGQFKPGSFVDATILVPSKKETVIIPKSSLQLVNDHSCVFVWGNADFELREVVTGITDGKQIEILKGLRPGEAVASVNAFHLKAELIKLNTGGGGCHGHAH